MTEMEEELRPCTECGKPVLWGTRHPVCGQRAMAAEANCGNCADGVPGGPDNCAKCGRRQQYSHWTPGWRKFPDVPAPVGPVLVTSASKVVWVADFAQSENVWRVGSGRDMVKHPPEAITHWMPLPEAAGLGSTSGVEGRKP